MFASIEAKLITLGVILLLIVGGSWYYGSTRFDAGAASIQTKWDAAKAVQTAAAAKASETARAAENSQATDFAGIASNYLQVTTHAYPSIADALPAALGAGTVSLRNDCPAAAAAGGGRAAATAGSRAADAASTQALADRVQAAIAAVRAGDEADARELKLGAQVTGLQAVLTAERATQLRKDPWPQ